MPAIVGHCIEAMAMGIHSGVWQRFLHRSEGQGRKRCLEVKWDKRGFQGT
jgi:hypothetical protein